MKFKSQRYKPLFRYICDKCRAAELSMQTGLVLHPTSSGLLPTNPRWTDPDCMFSGSTAHRKGTSCCRMFGIGDSKSPFCRALK